MTDAEIKDLRDLMRAATPGPLTVMARNAGEQCVAVVNQLELVPPNGVELAHEKADADFLAAAVNALPGLLDEVERLRANLKETTEHALQWADIAGAHGAEVDVLRKKVGRLRAMLSAAGCMMPTASGFIQLDTNDRIALDAAIDAAIGEEKRE